MKYQVAVGDRSVEIDLTGPTPLIDGVPAKVDLAAVPGGAVRHLLVDGRAYAIVAQAGAQRGSWNLTIGGKPVGVEALDERTRAIRAMAGVAEADTTRVIAAPMPGLVVRIVVEVGQTIIAGQGMVVVEAMKMENELKAPADGVVARIDVTPGQAVEKGAILIVLD